MTNADDDSGLTADTGGQHSLDDPADSPPSNANAAGGRDAVRAGRRRYEEPRRDRRGEVLKSWKERNPEKVKQYRDRYRQTHLEQIRRENRERERARRIRLREEQQAQQERRAYAREWYAQHREQYLQYQREYRAARKAQDPEKYREGVRARNKRWRDNHRDRENAKLRAKYWDDPDRKAKRAASYYKTHTDEVRARRRERYAANREHEREIQRRYRERQKFRRETGLPAPQLHRTPREERLANAAAADQFFTRPRTREERAELRKELGTPPELLAAWMRDCKRARAAHHLAEDAQLQARLRRELAPALTAKQIEEARLEAIGRQVNQRLRRKDPPRRAPHNDPAAPHPMLHPHPQTGLHR
ncbi:hypothetical protein NQ152_15830 [Microbacterium sp. zg.B48]|uniref:hypothetical protein n=1 Tax=Microbacterium sp. zg.B48 TaxID=2969408 RepID=UPI00214C1ABB|nr:hypothetical protein [Microbacterium sp. zg.B48]MCR2764976.1 hypothetical protein [Microbacterium sp. zg.B48]